MKHRLRKITSAFLAVIMISVITMLPITASALTQSAFDSKLSLLRSKYPNYSTWYNTFDGGSQCFGFARLIGYEVFGSYPSTWSVSYDFNSVKAGDIVRYGNNGSGGHSIFVTKVSSRTITFVDCNGNGNYSGSTKVRTCGIKWDNTTTIGSSLFGYGFSYIRKSPGIEYGNNPTGNNPQGYFDWVKSENPSEIHLRGWAFDRDDLNANIKLHVYINNSHYATITADKSRSDVNNVYPGVGNNHGFEDTLIVNKSGSLNIKVYAINVGSGSNTLVENGEKTITLTADPSTPKCMKTCTLDGHTYKLYACSTAWENAKIWCEKNGGYLATITSKREQFSLYKLLSEYSPLNFYLGGYSTSGSWKWVTEEAFSYKAWAANQPDCAGNAEFYLGIYKHSDTSGDLNFWNDFTNDYSGMAGFIFESGDIEENKVTPSDNPPTVSYSALIGDTWSENSTNGEALGKENENRFKAVKIGLENCFGGIKYSAHFSNTGWSNYVSDNENCGSANCTSSIEAIKMELYGEIASSYNVFYCTYVRDKGWLDWAKNGEAAGSTGGSLPITAIKIMLVPQIKYSSHIENNGWLDSVNDKEISGTVGKALRLEALKIFLNDTAYGNISYKTHLEYLDWGNSVYNGKASGTSNLKLQMEAFTVSLDGKANEMFDVMYKAHIEGIGWTDWVRNGTVAGTVGESLRLEAFKAMVVPKGYTGAESYREYTSEHYTVKFNSMGGKCNVKSKEVSYCGFYNNLPTPTKVNYVFAGWYDSTDYTNEITSSSTLEIKSNVTLYAKWMVIGDTNNDGEVDIRDATAIQTHLVQLIDFSDKQKAASDTNGDGKVDITDATQIQKYLVHLITSLG